ncbi:MAG: hypothetical protein M3Q95_06050 [Bacteroidota bacterium]|nr:hypothetical protein [Bacteroidota bacterium]
MKQLFKLAMITAIVTMSALSAKAQNSCKMYLEEKTITDITVEDAVKWCELTPPTVQCDDGKIYKLETFSITYLQLNPFMSQDFGIGEGGFPIMARRAVSKGKPGDTIILKDATYTDANGIKNTLPVISLKLK